MPNSDAFIKLDKIPTKSPGSWDKEETKGKTVALLQQLDELQNLLYAQKKHAVLVVMQGMDASGKDSLIKDVFTSMNPQGVRVQSFKEPTAEELSHDFLWRIHKNAPEKGMIQLFNRSHYEDILVTRVHGTCDDKTAAERIRAINHFEELLTANHTRILKLYLHVSHKEQVKRLEERLKIPRKMWKYSQADLRESKLWDQYREYYEEAINECNKIPWHIIPSDQNWYKSFCVASLLRDLLQSLKMEYPRLKNSGKKH